MRNDAVLVVSAGATIVIESPYSMTEKTFRELEAFYKSAFPDNPVVLMKRAKIIAVIGKEGQAPCSFLRSDPKPTSGS